MENGNFPHRNMHQIFLVQTNYTVIVKKIHNFYFSGVYSHLILLKILAVSSKQGERIQIKFQIFIFQISDRKNVCSSLQLKRKLFCEMYNFKKCKLLSHFHIFSGYEKLKTNNVFPLSQQAFA